MQKAILGLHHVTVVASNAKKNFYFYAAILGLRLVKKTINFDDPEVYHLYYGDEKGLSGTLITFFPYTGVPQGKKGKGQATQIAFSVASSSKAFWKARLEQFAIPYRVEKRFEEERLYCEDNDGLGLELVFNDADLRVGYQTAGIPLEYAIKGLAGVTLMEECPQQTVDLLVHQLEHKQIAEQENRMRFSAREDRSQWIDILCTPGAMQGLPGAGSVHHIAFATQDKRSQLDLRSKLVQTGMHATPIIDRDYFFSVYFREPGGVLFEIATLGPGFTVDESLEELGSSLKLPPWQEMHRAAIEKNLPPLQ